MCLNTLFVIIVKVLLTKIIDLSSGFKGYPDQLVSFMTAATISSFVSLSALMAAFLEH